MTDWVEITRRNSRSVQTTIGWIFWDPGAVARYEALGLAGPLGYIAARAAPLAPAGPDAVIAAFGSISPMAIRLAFDLVQQQSTFDAVWDTRNLAVVEGLREYAPDIVAPLEALGPTLWPVVESLPSVGHAFFGAHLRMPRCDDPLLSGWHAVNCVREWRGDLHWAIVAATGLDGVEASILHNAWLGYERDWLPKSRGSSPDELVRGWASLEARGLARNGDVTSDGIALRQHIEDETDRLGTAPWELLGEKLSRQFPADFEPPCELLLKRVDITAGPNYQPASRTDRILGGLVSDDERWTRGAAEFTAVTGIPAPRRGDDYVADVVIDQVFAEIWTRPGLTRKERRWIAITCASMAGVPFAMETHIGGALRSGDITVEEMREFVVHFAAYAGHPKATAVRAALDAVTP